jgi:hypothetical protein
MTLGGAHIPLRRLRSLSDDSQFEHHHCVDNIDYFVSQVSFKSRLGSRIGLAFEIS